MKSNYDKQIKLNQVNYLELPLTVFASQFPAQYMDLITNRHFPVDAIFDRDYIVRMKQFPDGRFCIEIGYRSDDWTMS